MKKTKIGTTAGFVTCPLLFLIALYSFFLVIYPSGALDGIKYRFSEKQGPRVLSEIELAKLLPYSIRVQQVTEMAAQGIIDARIADELKAGYLEQASKEFNGATVTLEMLQNLSTKDLLDGHQGGLLSRVRGFISFTNVMWTLASILFVIATRNILIKFVAPLFVLLVKICRFIADLPLEFWEFLLYSVCFFGIISGAVFVNESNEIGAIKDVGGYVSFAGCLGILFAFVFTAKVHDTGSKNVKAFYQASHVFYLMVFVPTAIFYQSALIGWLAVLALLSLFGFYCANFGMCYAIGFRDEDAVANASLAALALLLLFGAQRLNPAVSGPIPDTWIQPFSGSGLFMGTFVYFLGLLIASSRWYKKETYIICNVIALISGLVVLYIGSVYGITRCLGVGGTFFMLWCLEKYSEIPFGKHWVSFGLMGLSMILYGMAFFVRTHPEFVLGVFGVTA